MYSLNVVKMNSVILAMPLFIIILGSVVVTAFSKPEDDMENENLGNTLSEKLEEQDNLYKSNPFISYLDWPRLHFTGQFQADTATVNNDVRNYNLSNFTAWNLFPMPDGNGQWNPNGTGTFRLIGGKVTSVCYVTGICIAAQGQDPIIGSTLQERGTRTSAKMVDLDPQSMDTSTIYGWQVSIGHFFTADFRPAPLTHLWQKMRDDSSVDGDRALGASYQSSLKNITWFDGAGSSSFIRQLRRSMAACNCKELSIRFHLDMFNPETSSEQFLLGRIVGTIGVLGSRTPLLASPSRNLEAAYQIVRDAPFVLDQQNRKIHVDLGNSLPITMNGSHYVRCLGTLAVGFANNKKQSCFNDFDWIGILPYRTDDWYTLTAGVQSFPRFGRMTRMQVQKAAETPLVIAEVQGTWPNISCKRVLLREPSDGLLIRPQGDWVFRRDAMEPVHFDLFATEFGKAVSNVPVIIGTASRFLRNLTKSLKTGDHFAEPELDVPPLKLPQVPIITNGSGIASISIQTRDPGNPRKIIDGQIYRISYNLPYHPPKKEYVIRILVWDSYHYQSPPNWKDNVFPIFKLYANLFPVMTSEFIDLGNFHQVVENRRLIKMAMSLPTEHPNYMPVSRDLSKAKMRMIVEWLSQEQPLFDGDKKESAGSSHKSKPLRNNYKQLSKSSTIFENSISPHPSPEVLLDKHKTHRFYPTDQVRKDLPPDVMQTNLPSVSYGRRRAHTRPTISNISKASALPIRQRNSSTHTSTSLKKLLPKAAIKNTETLRKIKDYTFNNKPRVESKRDSKFLAKYYSLEQLRADLQTALGLEHATIPPYLTALASIKKEHNTEVKQVLNTILVQEMLHMALVSNLLKAIGGKPSLTHSGFVLNYPSVLPGGVHQGLVIPLEKLSKKLIKHVFMKIEEPTLTVTALEDRRLIIENLEKDYQGYSHHESRTSNKSGFSGTPSKRNPFHEDRNSETEEDEYRCLSHDSFINFHFAEESIFTRHKNTIGMFYNHILKTIGYLTKCGKDNSIFSGNPIEQLTSDHWYARDSCGHGEVIKVTDYSSAVTAIREIVEEGEGSSPCMPAAASLEIADLSHYFAFYSLYAGRVVSLRDWTGKERPRDMSYTELIWWKVCKSIYTFDGNEVRFDPEGVWPLLPNARMSDYIPWSRPYLLSYTFNVAYAKLLASLEHVFNGHPNDISDAMGLMFSVYLQAKELVRTPIHLHGSPDVGPTAGPTFEMRRV